MKFTKVVKADQKFEAQDALTHDMYEMMDKFLTKAYSKYSSTLTSADVCDCFIEAFERWQEATGLEFTGKPYEFGNK